MFNLEQAGLRNGGIQTQDARRQAVIKTFEARAPRIEIWRKRGWKRVHLREEVIGSGGCWQINRIKPRLQKFAYNMTLAAMLIQFKSIHYDWHYNWDVAVLWEIIFLCGIFNSVTAALPPKPK
jgi:hypothetical protein